MLLWCWCCLWGLSLLLSFVFFLTLRSISRCLKKIDRSIDRSIDRKSVVTSSGPKQKTSFFFFACVCVWRKHHHNHNHSITFYQKLQNFIKDDSSDDDSSDDGLVATRAKYTARAREREEVVGYKMRVATRWCAALINKSRLQKMRRLRRRFRRLRRRQKKEID